MKKIIFTASFILMMFGLLNGQNCNDLIVSEIVFGTVGNSLTGQKTQFNHSVEVYNPTENPIDLANYTIDLVPETGASTVIELEGIVQPEGVFVISNVTANAGISSVSDVLDLLLSFDGKVAIQLTKVTGEVVDKIGKQGIQSTSTVIDLAALLSDPSYLSSLDINLGSIENLLIRRKRKIASGRTDFTTEDFVKEWVLYPNFAIDDLGSHINSCVAPILAWADLDSMEPDAIRNEDDPDIVVGNIVSYENGIIADLPAGVEILVQSATHEFVTPLATDASLNLDFFYANFTTFPITVILPANSDANPVDLLEVIDDNIFEEDEGTGFAFGITNPNGTGATVDFDQNHFDILIKDNDGNTSTQNETLSNEIKVFPVIVLDQTTIKVSETGNSWIEAVRVFSLDGRESLDFQFQNEKEVRIDLSSLDNSGYYYVYIKTNLGLVTKKIIKATRK